MRTLSDTLTAAQKTGGKTRYKVTLTRTDYPTYTYGNTTDNPILNLNYMEKPGYQAAQVLIQNHDNALTTLDLRNYKAVISYGYNTSAGDEYSAPAPLWVLGQNFLSWGGHLVCALSLEGSSNLLAKDEGYPAGTLSTGDTQTIKTLLSAIFGATFPSYTWTTAYTVTYDSEDGIIDVFYPGDTLRIGVNESRQSLITKLLGYTGCVGRWEDDGEFHIFVPTTSGETYDYEYSLASGYHTFFSKAYQLRFVIPNYISVFSPPEPGGYYAGQATDADSYDLLPKRHHEILNVTSSSLARAIAESIIFHHQLMSAGGSGYVPMNVGAEVYDYVKVTDSRQGDSVTGNIGWITRHCAPGKFEMRFGFGESALADLIQAGVSSKIEITPEMNIDGKITLIIETLDNVLTTMKGNQEDIFKLTEMLYLGDDFVRQRVMSTKGDIIYRGNEEAIRLAGDAGVGYNFLRSLGTQGVEWYDLQELIANISGGTNRNIAFTLTVPKPTIDAPTAVAASATAKTAAKSLTVPTPTIDAPTVVATTATAKTATADLTVMIPTISVAAEIV